MLNRLYIFFIALIISCQNVSEYERIVKDEMARGVYTDSVQFGLKIGDSKKTFFTKAWELNADGKVTHGPNNEFIAYEIENMPEGKRVNHLFYGIFNDNDIMTGLDMRFYFLGWAPWNEELQSAKELPKNWHATYIITVGGGWSLGLVATIFVLLSLALGPALRINSDNSSKIEESSTTTDE